MKDKSLVTFSIGGSIILAVCCFTPVLVGLLSIVGLAGLTGYLDVVLLPALAFFVGLSVYALWRKQRCASAKKCKTKNKEN
jgi:mercuric ion transport protein